MAASIRKATREQTKTHNQRLILRTVYEQGPISRADIARVTRLARATVSNAVAELMEEGLVQEVGQEPSTGGKPAILLNVVDDSRHLIGVDLAENEFRGAVVNLRGVIRRRCSLPVDTRNGKAALAATYTLIDELLASASAPLLGIGIGTPGLMDAKAGVVRQAVNLDWQGLPLAALLRERYDLPVYIANDSQVAALGEYTFGNGQGATSLIVVKVGRGVGAGIVINGRLYFGDGCGAGEIGHVVVVDNGDVCRCGHRGCLETVTSARAILRQARVLTQEAPHSLLRTLAGDPDAISIETILEAVRQGDRTLAPIIVEVGRYLGVAVAQLIAVLNIEQIVIAGSVAEFGELLLEPIRQEMRQRALAALANDTCVTTSRLGADIVILGAAALLLARELSLV